MSTPIRFSGRALALTITFGLTLLSCASLKLQLHNASVQKPSNVALYFSVEKSNGAPVAKLDAKAFRIFEDGRLISPFESKQTILNPEVAVVHYTLLLLDLSGSVTESGSLHTLVQAAASFADKVAKRQKIAIYGFEGGADLVPVTPFTTSSSAVSAGLARISTRKSRDPSTNLHGAVVRAVKVLESAMKRSTQPLRFGTLVIFTDGTDRAHRVTAEKMHEALDNSHVNVFVIGLGAEIDQGELRRLGRNGFVQATEGKNVRAAFDEVAARIEAAARKFYLLSYCSPSRAGTHELRVELKVDGQSGGLSHQFKADGFGPRCDPKRKPRFSVHRVRLKPTQR
ncbi:MAG: VWA domain-containing protein [Myxococcales bacterium]|nr:VWA domain-containing protein [Myxococcales bacterium]